MSDAPVFYWDACVFLSYLEGIEGRAHEIEAILDEAAAGSIEIITSELSLVEVAYVKHERGEEFSESDERRIDELWTPGGSPVKLVEFHRLIALRARALIRESKRRGLEGPRSADAIHLATALQMEADRFHSYDPKLPKFEEITGFPIGEPRSSQIPLDLKPGSAGEDPAGGI